MRISVTLDDEVAARIRTLARERRLSFDVALDEVLRRGLAEPAAAGRRVRRFLDEPHDGEVGPGIDAGRLNRLSDQLETAAFIEKERTSRQSPGAPVSPRRPAASALPRAERVEAAAQIRSLALPVPKAVVGKAETGPAPKRVRRKRPAAGRGSPKGSRS